MTTPQSQQHLLQPPRTQKKSDASLAESGYGSKQSSKVELTAIREDEQLTILSPLKIHSEGEVAIISESAAAHFKLNITDCLPDVQDLRRGSEESNPSCSSDASTPASTRPLLSTQSRQHNNNFKSNLTLKLNKSTQKHVQPLQTPKPSDLATVKSQECIPKTYADEVLLCKTVRCEMPAFVRQTDIEELASLLYSKKLLHSDDYAKLKSIPSDKQRGNHFYMEILPRKGRHTYRRLYECLKRETEHLGHRDLVEILDKALRDGKPPHSSSDSSPTESGNHPGSTDSQAKHCCTVL